MKGRVWVKEREGGERKGGSERKGGERKDISGVKERGREKKGDFKN